MKQNFSSRLKSWYIHCKYCHLNWPCSKLCTWGWTTSLDNHMFLFTLLCHPSNPLPIIVFITFVRLSYISSIVFVWMWLHSKFSQSQMIHRRIIADIAKRQPQSTTTRQPTNIIDTDMYVCMCKRKRASRCCFVRHLP